MSSLILPNTQLIDLSTQIDPDPDAPLNYDPDSEDEHDELAEYRNGGEGFVKWAEANIRVPIQYGDASVSTWVYLGEMPDKPHPITGRSFKYFWEKQKEQLLRALEMQNGHMKHRLIIFCEPRGDGKSYRAMLIQCWKFFCFPRQMIVLGANSKEQTKFVHFQIIRDMILNSPRLIGQLGRRNVQDKEIRMKNSRGEVVSFIKPISTMQGIVSNITGYTFSEMFKMKDMTFFNELHGSIRNIPNAIGVIDSTVSTRSHKLYHLYEAYRQGKSKTLFFCYRYSKEARQEDYWHPNQTQAQLDDYEHEFGEEAFNMFFKNTWESGQGSIITPAMIQSMQYTGLNNAITAGPELVSALTKINGYEDQLVENGLKGDHSSDRVIKSKLIFLKKMLTPITNIYDLQDQGSPRLCSLKELNALGDFYRTDWAIGAGADRADPLKKTGDGANSIVTIVAKGLYNSRGIDVGRFLQTEKNPLYIYVLLSLTNVITSDIEEIKDVLIQGITEYDGIDTLCSERWGMWDMKAWCEEEGIEFEPISPTYALQRDVFRGLFTLLRDGRFKSAPVAVVGAKSNNILYEEMEIFSHDTDKRWFGSPEKNDPGGIQDDSMYSLGYSIFGLRNKTPFDFRKRTATNAFAQYYGDKSDAMRMR